MSLSRHTASIILKKNLSSLGVFFCLIVIIVILIGVKLELKSRNYFLAIFACIALDLIANMTGILTRGETSQICSIFVRIANFCEFLFGYVLSFVLSRYLLSVIGGEEGAVYGRYKSLVYAIPLVILILAVVLLITTQFTGLFYTIDASNVYHRGELFWLSQALALCSLIFNIAMLAVYSKHLTKKEIIAFSIYNALPFVAMIVQLFIYGLFWLLFATTFAGIVLFLFMLSDQMDKFVQRERENADMQISITLSQIQPHFLYNSLTAIAGMCEREPQKAKQAIISFAEYLRVNMNSLKQKEPVAFQTELEHIKTYAMLEELRFGDKLKIIYDISTTDFCVPALSVQPLVENAVKHGVGMKKDGGTVTISTIDAVDEIKVIVADDGVGFDPDSLSQNNGSVGIENVRNRLQSISGAKLVIESELGIGTRAIISVPRRDI